MNLTNLYARILVVLKALPTYLTAVAAAIAAAHEQIAGVLPEQWQGPVANGVIIVVGALAAAVGIIRNVTPVASIDRGLLPDDYADLPTRLQGDAGQAPWGLVLTFIVGFILGALCYANDILVGAGG